MQDKKEGKRSKRRGKFSSELPVNDDNNQAKLFMNNNQTHLST